MDSRWRGAVYGPPHFSFLALVMFAAVGFCASFSNDAAAAEGESQSFNVAVALPSGGRWAALGREVRAAAELAVADYLTATGGIGPQPTLSWYDDRCSADGGAGVAAEITARTAPERRPMIVIGHACPSAAQVAGVVYAAAGQTFLAAGALPQRIGTVKRLGPRHFRLPGEASPGQLIGETLAALPAEARVAFVRDRTQLAQTTLQAAADVLKARGRPAPLLETFAGAEKDFSALAQRLGTTGITHVALAAFPSEAALLMAELKKAVPGLVVYAGDTLAGDDFGRSASAAADGMRVAMAPDGRAFPLSAPVARRLAEQGVAASRTALATYAALQVVCSALQQAAGKPDFDMAKSLATSNFETIFGTVGFDGGGVARVPSTLFYTWDKGQLHAPN